MNIQDKTLTSATTAAFRTASAAWVDALAATAAIAAHPGRLLSDLILAEAQRRGEAPALLSEHETFTFAELGGRIATYQHWALSRGLTRGHTVALVMENRPDYVAAWLGLTRSGCTVALINTALRGAALAHALRVAAASHAVVDAVHADEFALVCAAEGLVIAVSAPPPLQVPAPAALPHDLTVADRALLIYTSGTTGLPKAAVVSHRRVLNWALWFKGLLGNTEADRMYNCLPLCHSVGGIVAVAATLAAGGSTVIAGKFSASRFWSDIRRWNCTQVQYIGELCRYLMAQPPSAEDGNHGLRLAVGNGLRPDIWESFRARFRVPQIIEFYAATEGSFSLYNVGGPAGSIGRIPPFLRHRFKVALVRHDYGSGLPVRDAEGLCIPVAAGEAGEAIGLLGEADGGVFEGYTNAIDTDHKVLRNVFRPGDAWFRTGDLMRADAGGNYFFIDRIGDTFRWKGENVATLEVANAAAAAPGVRDAVVYGVAVPRCDGKAGMAFIDADHTFNFQSFLSHMRERLPAYAIPLFLRLGGAARVTETFKHRKSELAAENFDPARSDDRLFLLHGGAYRTLDRPTYDLLMSGGLRL